MRSEGEKDVEVLNEGKSDDDDDDDDDDDTETRVLVSVVAVGTAEDDDNVHDNRTGEFFHIPLDRIMLLVSPLVSRLH